MVTNHQGADTSPLNPPPALKTNGEGKQKGFNNDYR